MLVYTVVCVGQCGTVIKKQKHSYQCIVACINHWIESSPGGGGVVKCIFCKYDDIILVYVTKNNISKCLHFVLIFL